MPALRSCLSIAALLVLGFVCSGCPSPAGRPGGPRTRVPLDAKNKPALGHPLPLPIQIEQYSGNDLVLLGPQRMDLRRREQIAMEEYRLHIPELLPWKVVNPPRDVFDALDAAYTGSGTLVAVGAAGRAFVSADGGLSWQRLNIPSREDLRGVCFPSPSVGYIVGDDGLILRTHDGGSTWSDPRAVPRVDEGSRNYGVFFLDDMRGVVVGGTVWPGAYWLNGSFSDDCAIGFIRHTTDGGATWSESSLGYFEESAWNNGAPGIIRAVHFSNTGTGIAVGGGWTRGPRYAGLGLVPVILRTTDVGETWTRIPGGGEGLTGICAFNRPTANVWLATPSGPRMGIIRSEDDGLTWQNTDVAACECWPVSLHGVTSRDDSHALTCGSELLESEDAGRTWTRRHYFEGDTYVVVFSDTLRGVIVGPFSSIYVTSSGGTYWARSNQFRQVPAPENVTLLRVHFWSATEGYATGTGFISPANRYSPVASGLLSTFDGGATWSRTGDASAPQVGFPYVLHFFDGGDIGLYGGTGGLYRTTSGGSLWSPLRSSDGGNTWSDDAQGDPQLSAHQLSFSGNDHGALLAVPQAQAKARIYRSQDGGRSWVRCTLPAAVADWTITDVSASGTRALLATAEDEALRGYVLRSIDGGANWSTYALPDCMMPTQIHRVTSPGQTDTFYVIDGYGHVYRSDDQVAWVPRGQLPSEPGYYGFRWSKLWFSDVSTGWAIGGGGMPGAQANLIRKTTDGGSSWIADHTTEGIPVWLNDISGWPGQFAVVAGPGYLMLRRKVTP